MIVRGLSLRTREAYLNDVELLVRRTGKHPARLSRDDLRAYFASLVREHDAAPSTVRQHLCAAKLFFEVVLGRKESFFVDARPQRRRKLPVVLTFDELRRTLRMLRVHRLRTAAIVAYSCGLRKSELLSLSVPWINADGGSLHIHNAKGGVDRVVPLPARTLAVLREHWRWERPSGTLLFESPQRRARPGLKWSGDTLRKALKAAALEAGVNRPVCLHTLRHCYASHLLERGVALGLIQRWLGHKSVQSTMIYTHVTKRGLERAREALAEMTEAL
jgi:integrase